MAKTVLESFDEFMSNCVNLDKEVVAAARKSRDNLLENISEFVDEDFFELCSDYNVHFGSFARKTKCRELDDIDLMIGISAEGALYNNFDKWDDVHIIASQTSAAQIACTRNDGTLNSTQVVNLFKSKFLGNRNEGDAWEWEKHEIAIQSSIYEYRKNSVMIPDWFYKLRQHKYETIETEISKAINKKR